MSENESDVACLSWIWTKNPARDKDKENTKMLKKWHREEQKVVKLLLLGKFKDQALPISHSTRVVNRTSHLDVSWRGRHTLGPNESYPDVLLRSGVCRMLLVRPTRTSFLRPRRIRTFGKLSYGSKVGRPLNVLGRLAE